MRNRALLGVGPARGLLAALAVACVIASWAPADSLGQSRNDWRKAGFLNDRDIDGWKRAGFTFEEAVWYSLAFGTREHTSALWLKERGVTVELGEQWLTAFEADPVDGFANESDFFSTDEHCRRCELYMAANYLERGIPLEDAMRWRAAHIGGAEVHGWVAAGVSAEDARVWQSGGIPDGGLAARLIAAGLDAGAYFEWESFIRIFGLELAGKWRAAGVEPSEASTRALAGVHPSMLEMIVAECGGTVQPRGQIYVENPFDAEGRCFVIEARVSQLIDRTRALASDPREPRATVRVDFAPRSALPERSGFLALAKATKPYRYTTVAGDERIVADLVVLGVVD